MNTISIERYTDITALRSSVDVLYEGLQNGHIIVALPQKDPNAAPTIEIRTASLWEKFRSLIRFKSTSTRLATIQPLLSQFFKNNDELLTNYPDLYPKLLSIYLNSVCKREAILPCCLTEKMQATRPTNASSEDDDALISFRIEDQMVADEAPIFENISVPYKLLKNLPHDFKQYIPTQESPIELDAFSRETFNAFIKYQEEGELDKELTHDQLIELAQLAHSFEHKKLTDKIVIALINFLREDSNIVLFDDIARLITTLDIQDQTLIMRLIAKGKHLQTTHLGEEDLDQSLTQMSLHDTSTILEEHFPDNWLADYIRAHCYEHGIGVKQNFKKALRLYEVVANKGIAWGQCDLGRCYHYVSGKLLDAFQLYTLAADQGLASARYHQAVCYTYGLGVKTDTAKALALFQKLAAERDGSGLYGLGNFYKNGTCVKQDTIKAIKLYELAGDEPKALYELALYYENGTVLKKDPQEAFKRYEVAAYQGLRDAEYKLGRYYQNQKNAAKAEYWLTRAKNQGHKDAERALKQLELAAL